MTCSYDGTFTLRTCGVAVLCVLISSRTMATDVAWERGRPLLRVQRWDMYSGKGATQQQEFGYLPAGFAGSGLRSVSPVFSL